MQTKPLPNYVLGKLADRTTKIRDQHKCGLMMDAINDGQAVVFYVVHNNQKNFLSPHIHNGWNAEAWLDGYERGRFDERQKIEEDRLKSGKQEFLIVCTGASFFAFKKNVFHDRMDIIDHPSNPALGNPRPVLDLIAQTANDPKGETYTIRYESRTA